MSLSPERCPFLLQDFYLSWKACLSLASQILQLQDLDLICISTPCKILAWKVLAWHICMKYILLMAALKSVNWSYRTLVLWPTASSNTPFLDVWLGVPESHSPIKNQDWGVIYPGVSLISLTLALYKELTKTEIRIIACKWKVGLESCMHAVSYLDTWHKWFYSQQTNKYVTLAVNNQWCFRFVCGRTDFTAHEKCTLALSSHALYWAVKYIIHRINTFWNTSFT